MIKYLQKRNPIPQQILACNFFHKSDILAYFELVPLCRGVNFQFSYQYVSVRYFFVNFLFFKFLVVYSKTLSYLLFVLSRTLLKFVFVCNSLWLFCCTDTNNLCPLQHQWKWCQLILHESRFTLPLVPPYHPVTSVPSGPSIPFSQ